MITLTDLRSLREDAERLHRETMNLISQGQSKPEIIARALGFHREVCAAYAAEISLISDGKLPPAPIPNLSPEPITIP